MPTLLSRARAPWAKTSAALKSQGAKPFRVTSTFPYLMSVIATPDA